MYQDNSKHSVIYDGVVTWTVLQSHSLFFLFQKRIRENLRETIKHGEIDDLEKSMEVFVNNKLEDGGDYSDAEERMEFLQMRKGNTTVKTYGVFLARMTTL